MKRKLSNDDEEFKVWFQLVDAVTGEAYKVVRAATVSLASDAIVDTFTDAVKAKFPNKLSSIDAADLVVYKNKEAFDKRNDQEENVIHLNLITGRAVGRRLDY